MISGTPATAAPANSVHAITIANAATGGLPTGTFNMNIVYNAPFFTYDSKTATWVLRASNPNIFNFLQINRYKQLALMGIILATQQQH